MRVTDGGFRPDATFVGLPFHDVATLTEVFRRAVLALFVRRDLMEVETAHSSDKPTASSITDIAPQPYADARALPPGAGSPPPRPLRRRTTHTSPDDRRWGLLRLPGCANGPSTGHRSSEQWWESSSRRPSELTTGPSKASSQRLDSSNTE